MPSRKVVPTHAELATFIESFLPPSLNLETQAREVPFFYHTVRHKQYSPSRQLTSRIVFSITPTRGVYTALDALSPRYQSPVCFLHRPFNLDRRSVKYGALVLSSHKSFDEHLTVGWNIALGQRLGLDLENAQCIKGYKGDSERKIGLIARLQRSTSLDTLVETLRAEYSGNGELFASKAISTTGPDAVHQTELCSQPGLHDVETGRPIEVVAIMNAFHAEEVQRVLVAAFAAGWISDINNGSTILYLTGAAREYGIEAVAKVGMPAFCVGHVACEEWGIRYLAQQTRDQWPGVDVVEVFEAEEPRRIQVVTEPKQDGTTKIDLTD